MLLLKGYKHDNSLTVKGFVEKFLNELNESHDTLFKNGHVQTPANCHRSLGDIHKICKSYYPEVELEYVKNVLLSFGDDLVGHRCGGIGKRIFELRTNPKYAQWHQLGTDQVDEFGEKIIYLTYHEAKNIIL